MTSQDLLSLFLTRKVLHLTMKYSGFFSFFPPSNFHPTILSEEHKFCLKVDIVITPDLAFHAIAC